MFENRFICASESEDLIEKYKNLTDLNEKQVWEHALQFNDAISVALDERLLSTSASNNVDNEDTEVADGVEGDAFSPTEQSRFHPPDQPNTDAAIYTQAYRHEGYIKKAQTHVPAPGLS